VTRFSGPTFDRRDFLTLTSTGLVAMAVGSGFGGAAAEVAASTSDQTAAEPLSVGYVAGSNRLADLRRLPWQAGLPGGDGGVRGVDGVGARVGRASPVEVVPAAGLGIGDQTLAGESVRVRICGLYPGVPGAKTATVDAATLWVLFPSPDPALPEPLPFLAWSFDRRPENLAAPVGFTLPLELDGGLELSLSVVGGGIGTRVGGRLAQALGGAGGAPTVARQLATRFTVDWERGLPRLLRGIYLLGLAPGTWDQPVDLPAAGEPSRPDLLSLVLTVEPIEAE
jgi:hypothetical protein